MALFTHFYTLHYSLRPFGSALLFVGYDADMKVPELYMVEPNGMVKRYFGCAAGKGAQAANTELEKLFSKKGGVNGISCAEAVEQLARIIYTVRDLSNDKPFELEMAWCCEGSDYKFEQVPGELVRAADEAGKSASPVAAAPGAGAAPPTAEEE